MEILVFKIGNISKVVLERETSAKCLFALTKIHFHILLQILFLNVSHLFALFLLRLSHC